LPRRFGQPNLCPHTGGLDWVCDGKEVEVEPIVENEPISEQVESEVVLIPVAVESESLSSAEADAVIEITQPIEEPAVSKESTPVESEEPVKIAQGRRPVVRKGRKGGPKSEQKATESETATETEGSPVEDSVKGPVQQEKPVSRRRRRGSPKETEPVAEQESLECEVVPTPRISEIPSPVETKSELISTGEPVSTEDIISVELDQPVKVTRSRKPISGRKRRREAPKEVVEPIVDNEPVSEQAKSEAVPISKSVESECLTSAETEVSSVEDSVKEPVQQEKPVSRRGRRGSPKETKPVAEPESLVCEVVPTPETFPPQLKPVEIEAEEIVEDKPAGRRGRGRVGAKETKSSVKTISLPVAEETNTPKEEELVVEPTSATSTEESAMEPLAESAEQAAEAEPVSTKPNKRGGRRGAAVKTVKSVAAVEDVPTAESEEGLTADDEIEPPAKRSTIRGGRKAAIGRASKTIVEASVLEEKKAEKEIEVVEVVEVVEEPKSTRGGRKRTKTVEEILEVIAEPDPATVVPKKRGRVAKKVAAEPIDLTEDQENIPPLAPKQSGRRGRLAEQVEDEDIEGLKPVEKKARTMRGKTTDTETVTKASPVAKRKARTRR